MSATHVDIVREAPQGLPAPVGPFSPPTPLASAMAALAPALAAYRDALMVEGFARDEAVVLCASYQRTLLGHPC